MKRIDQSYEPISHKDLPHIPDYSERRAVYVGDWEYDEPSPCYVGSDPFDEENDGSEQFEDAFDLDSTILGYDDEDYRSYDLSNDEFNPDDYESDFWEDLNR